MNIRKIAVGIVYLAIVLHFVKEIFKAIVNKDFITGTFLTWTLAFIFLLVTNRLKITKFVLFTLFLYMSYGTLIYTRTFDIEYIGLPLAFLFIALYNSYFQER